MSGPRVAAVIVAAGRGERLGGETPKQLRDLGGLPVLEWSVRAFASHPRIRDVVVVLPPELAAAPPPRIALALRVGADTGGVRAVVAGGDTRAESVGRGTGACPDDVDIVLVHDGVRPFVDAATIDRVCDAAVDGPVVPVVPVVDTIKRIDDAGLVVESPPRHALRRAQTPQGFPSGLLRRLQAEAATGRETGTGDGGITDEGVLCERAGLSVRTVAGDPHNLKITDPEDLAYARWLVETGVIPRPSMA